MLELCRRFRGRTASEAFFRLPATTPRLGKNQPRPLNFWPNLRSTRELLDANGHSAASRWMDSKIHKIITKKKVIASGDEFCNLILIFCVQIPSHG